jgi:hypothetical protein
VSLMPSFASCQAVVDRDCMLLARCQRQDGKRSNVLGAIALIRATTRVLAFQLPKLEKKRMWLRGPGLQARAPACESTGARPANGGCLSRWERTSLRRTKGRCRCFPSTQRSIPYDGRDDCRTSDTRPRLPAPRHAPTPRTSYGIRYIGIRRGA